VLAAVLSPLSAWASDDAPAPISLAAEVVCEKPTYRVGQIFIVGGRVVPHAVIHGYLSLSPGDILSESNLRLAEVRLEQSGLFEVDAAHGLRPTVTALSPGSEGRVTDVRVEVQERSDTWLRWRLHRGGRALAAWPGGGLPAVLLAWLGD
jgi:hypothetical protein